MMVTAEVGPPQVVEDLVSCVKRGHCILFLGAGCHAPPPPDAPFVYPEDERPPLGGALAERLARECGFTQRLPNDSVYDLQRVSLCYETTQGLGRKALVDSLLRHLRDGKEPSPAVHMLAGLPFKIIVTTNYDHLLEKALHAAGKEPARLIYDPEHDTPSPDMTEDPTPERPLLFKIHGDFDRRESIVITDEDYITFVQRMSEKVQAHPVPPTVRFRMMKWPMLFVGFSLRDYNLRLLFRTLRWSVDPAVSPQCFSVDMSPDPLVLQVWQNERRFVTFLIQNLWAFVPWLYREVHGRDFPPGPGGDE